MQAMPTPSVLEQSPIRSGATPAQAIGETLELAEACDRLGYHRYWLAEHRSCELLAEVFELPRAEDGPGAPA